MRECVRVCVRIHDWLRDCDESDRGHEQQQHRPAAEVPCGTATSRRLAFGTAAVRCVVIVVCQLQEYGLLFECFPYVCPEHVLVKRSFSFIH
jgi:hypothetical protein